MLAAPFNLAVVAGNTPRDVDVKITDCYVERLSPNDQPDLVGITSLTASYPQAVQIADAYRRRGVTVVMGGIQPTAMPEDALQHCDAVVLGEAEHVWPQLIEDFRCGRLKSTYQNTAPPALDNLALPRRDLIKPGAYLFTNFVETSRGCPFNCYYCSDSTVYGPRYRFRPVEEVADEIRSIRNGNFFVFVDNNIVGNPSRAKELFEALIPLRIRWVGQASITMAYDLELVRLAKRSGCLGVLVGLETLKKDLLRAIGKPVDPARYKENIRVLQNHGIFVQGEFIFGFDEDDPSVFAETVRFAKEAQLASARFAILKPYPGTRLYDQWIREGRITVDNWGNYHTKNVVFTPAQMTAEALSRGRNWAYEQFFSVRSTYERIGLFRKNNHILWLLNMVTLLTRNSLSR